MVAMHKKKKEKREEGEREMKEKRKMSEGAKEKKELMLNSALGACFYPCPSSILM